MHSQNKLTLLSRDREGAVRNSLLPLSPCGAGDLVACRRGASRGHSSGPLPASGPGQHSCRIRVPRLLFTLLLSTLPCLAGTFVIPAGAPGPWAAILSSAGHASAGQTADKKATDKILADIYVAPLNAPASADWRGKVINGAVVILEGSSPLASSFGFNATSTTVSAVHIVDEHNPLLPVIWKKAIDIPRFEIPPTAHVFATERWSGAPVVVGYHLGSGAVLWVAASPGATGYERFPYLMQALADLGFQASFRASRLWAFFDYSYRSRADPDYPNLPLVRADAHRRLGDAAAARADLQDQVERHPAVAEGWLQLGRARAAAHDARGARVAYCQAKALGDAVAAGLCRP